MMLPKPITLAFAATLLSPFVAGSPSRKRAFDAKGFPCENYAHLPVQDMPEECIHQNICVDLAVEPVQCSYDPCKKYDHPSSLAGLNPYCVREILCERKLDTKRFDCAKPLPENEANKIIDFKWSEDDTGVNEEQTEGVEISLDEFVSEYEARENARMSSSDETSPNDEMGRSGSKQSGIELRDESSPEPNANHRNQKRADTCMTPGQNPSEQNAQEKLTVKYPDGTIHPVDVKVKPSIKNICPERFLGKVVPECLFYTACIKDPVVALIYCGTSSKKQYEFKAMSRDICEQWLFCAEGFKLLKSEGANE